MTATAKSALIDGGDPSDEAIRQAGEVYASILAQPERRAALLKHRAEKAAARAAEASTRQSA